ncbi:MAG: molybdenum cofactor guanylyltransferase [Calditrichaeota bacterium]|nr:molybdenum cofactor guanylyltransferase [Calditrichota bacterium]
MRKSAANRAEERRLPAYVLAGGESRRFGQDKTLLEWEGEPLIARTVRIAKEVAHEVKIVAREREKFEFVGVPVLLDIVERAGPLAGLLTALEDCAQDYCFILSCDLPHLTADWLMKLAEFRQDKQVVFSQSEKGMEPLCAIYAKATLPFWWERFRQKKWSLCDGIEELGGLAVEFVQEPNKPIPFFNLNWPGDNLHQSPRSSC